MPPRAWIPGPSSSPQGGTQACWCPLTVPALSPGPWSLARPVPTFLPVSPWASVLPHPAILLPCRGVVGCRLVGPLPPCRAQKGGAPPCLPCPTPTRSTCSSRMASLPAPPKQPSQAARGQLRAAKGRCQQARARGTPSWASCPPPTPPACSALQALLKTNSTRGPTYDTHAGGLSGPVPSATNPGCGGHARQVCPLRLLGSPPSGCPTAWLPRVGLLLPQAPHDQQGLRGPGNSRCLVVGTAQETGEAGGQRGQQGCGNREGMPHEPGLAVAPGLGD